jgi:hypothetical protein
MEGRSTDRPILWFLTAEGLLVGSGKSELARPRQQSSAQAFGLLIAEYVYGLKSERITYSRSVTPASI